MVQKKTIHQRYRSKLCPMHYFDFEEASATKNDEFL